MRFFDAWNSEFLYLDAFCIVWARLGKFERDLNGIEMCLRWYHRMVAAAITLEIFNNFWMIDFILFTLNTWACFLGPGKRCDGNLVLCDCVATNLSWTQRLSYQRPSMKPCRGTRWTCVVLLNHLYSFHEWTMPASVFPKMLFNSMCT